MSGIYRFPILKLPPLRIPAFLPLPRPWKNFRRLVFVIRATDVREVLSEDGGEDPYFSVRDYGQHMRDTVGDFFLGMDPGDGTYDREKKLAMAAFLDGSGPGTPQFDQIRETMTRMVRDATVRAIQNVERTGQAIDVVADLANQVPVALVREYFGIHDRGGTLLGDCQEISYYIFNFLSEVPGASAALGLRRRAEAAGRRLETSIGEQVRKRWEQHNGPGTSPRQHVLDRLLGSGGAPSDVDAHLELVRRTLTGLISGTLVATVGLFVSAVDRLMDLPTTQRSTLQYAALAARDRGDPSHLWHFLREAARFGVTPPFLFRRCRRRYVLAKGSARESTVLPGDIVVVSPWMAGRDPYAYGRPSEFIPSRPDDAYLLFGYGLHACVGAFLGQILMVGMATELFTLRGLDRDRWRGRRVTYRGAPKRLLLTFLPT